jgi:hypothetical protein
MAEAFDIPASVVGETRHPTNKQHNTMSREYILKMWPECSKRALRFGMENPEMFVELIAVLSRTPVTVFGRVSLKILSTQATIRLKYNASQISGLSSR